jgi:hypothetical protein
MKNIIKEISRIAVALESMAKSLEGLHRDLQELNRAPSGEWTGPM